VKALGSYFFGQFNLLHELLFGLLFMGAAAFLIWLWHLFVVTPARLKRDLDLCHSENPSALKEGGRLFVESFIASLSSALRGPEDVESLLSDGLNDYVRNFAVLRVRNEGEVKLTSIVASCSLANSHDEIPCVWSGESGDEFTKGERHTADLDVGDFKLLVIAQAFGTGAWARLEDRGRHFERPQEGNPGGLVPDYLSRSRDILNLGSDLEVAVRFKAFGLDQTERFRLRFESRKPVITQA